MMKQRANRPMVFINGRTYSNTQVSRSVSLNSSPSSVYPVLLSSSSSNFVSPTHLSLKEIKPEPWQRLFEGKKQQELPRKKNQSNARTIIDEDFINLLNEHSLFDEESQTSFLPAPIQTHIDHLYEQIDDLTLQLVEERLRHKQSRIKAAEILSNQLKGREKQSQQQLQRKILDHQIELNEQKEKYSILINEIETQGLQREQQLKDELDFIKNSFHTYKINLEQEKDEQFQMKINEALVTMKKELPEKKDETTGKKLADATANQEPLGSLNKELTLTKRELDETKERVISLSAQLKELDSQHTKTIRELNDCHFRVDEKTKEIEKLRAERVDQ